MLREMTAQAAQAENASAEALGSPQAAVLEPGGKAAPLPARRPPSPGGAHAPKKVISIRKAIERATKEGACHPEGLSGWLIDRAQGGIQDRQIFAQLIGRCITPSVQEGAPSITVNLAWLGAGRGVGQIVPGSHGTITAQNAGDETQVIDVTEESVD
jgi:hypothetical protein